MIGIKAVKIKLGENMFAQSKKIVPKMPAKSPQSRAAKGESVYSPLRTKKAKLPLFVNPAFLSYREAAANYKEDLIDLNEYLIRNPASTFLIRVTGQSMNKAGIETGDMLVVDRSLRAVNKKIVVAAINDELLVKRIIYRGRDVLLTSENPNFPPIKIDSLDKFEIWGVVTAVIKKT